MAYRLVRRLFLLVARPMFRFRVEGVERLPQRGGAIVVARHRSWLDPPCVGAACPRTVRFLILSKVYEKPWARWFYRSMRALPVAAGGVASLGALREALRYLQRGGLIGVFPEGGVVTGSDGRLHPGAALLAVRSGAPIVPLEIEGSERAWPHGRWYPGPASVRVTFGVPVLPPPGRGRGAVNEMLRRIEAALDALSASASGAARRQSRT